MDFLVFAEFVVIWRCESTFPLVVELNPGNAAGYLLLVKIRHACFCWQVELSTVQMFNDRVKSGMSKHPGTPDCSKQ